MIEKRKIHRILVVDDEPRILRFVRLNLCSCGFEVITASDGDNALNIIDLEKPDLMILDIFMPGLDGFGVLKRLREKEDGCGSPHMPVIVFSARSSVSTKALNLGANDFIAKPFQPEEMAEKIRNTITRCNYF
jgi:two-component system KDP operon response regulator KdpE